MRRRYVFYVAFFTAIAAVGFINVATGGLINHLAVDYSPYHSHGEVEIDSNGITISENGSAEFSLRNVERFSYTIEEESFVLNGRPPDLKFEFNPSHRLRQDSIPPTWIWRYHNPSVDASVSFDAEYSDSGTYNYTLKAYGGGSVAEEDLTVIVE